MTVCDQLPHEEDAANIDDDLHLDPRDLPCDMLVLLDDVFTLGDALSFDHGSIWTNEAYDAYCNKIDNVEHKISAEFDKPIPDIDNMLLRWQNDKTIRFAIFSNKDNGNV